MEKITRKLTDQEIEQGKLVFKNHIDYSIVKINFGKWLSFWNYGRVLGNNIHFPADAQDRAGYFPWLIHELTHIWQFQKFGWIYVPKALAAQITTGYNYGGEKGLIQAIEKGKAFTDFNMEQQGDISRDYYRRFIKDKPLYPWEHFISQID